MKTFKASHLAKKPAEVFAEARLDGVIIQQCRTNGEVVEEFILIKKDSQSIWDLYQGDELMPVGLR